MAGAVLLTDPETIEWGLDPGIDLSLLELAAEVVAISEHVVSCGITVIVDRIFEVTVTVVGLQTSLGLGLGC